MLLFRWVKKKSLSWTLKLDQWYSTQIRCVHIASNFVQRHGLGTKKSFSLIIGFCLNFPSLRGKVNTVTKTKPRPPNKGHNCYYHIKRCLDWHNRYVMFFIYHTGQQVWGLYNPNHRSEGEWHLNCSLDI